MDSLLRFSLYEVQYRSTGASLDTNIVLHLLLNEVCKPADIDIQL